MASLLFSLGGIRMEEVVVHDLRIIIFIILGSIQSGTGKYTFSGGKTTLQPPDLEKVSVFREF